MIRMILLFAVVSAAFAEPAAWAAPPQIKDITPAGIRRGEPADVSSAGPISPGIRG